MVNDRSSPAVIMLVDFYPRISRHATIFIEMTSEVHSKSATRALDSLSLINEEVNTFQIKGHSPSRLRKLKSKKTVIKGLFYKLDLASITSHVIREVLVNWGFCE